MCIRDRYAAGKKYYVLEETSVPAGYRKTNDIYLRYEPTTNTLISENKWQSGGATSGKLSVTVTGDFVTDGKNDYQITDNDQVFAVVLKRDKNIGTALPQDEDGWSGISGNALEGYKLTLIQSLEDIKTLSDDSKYYFKKGADGKYQAQISQLPGDVQMCIRDRCSALTFSSAWKAA